jgi:AcrR family transcriptional regulator
MPAEGLRERKKVATRAAIGMAAWRLATERGPEAVRVEDIAAAADVSRRTFHNYFATKEEAMASLPLDRVERICAALREAPASEPLAESLARLFVEEYASGRRPDGAQRAAVRRAAAGPGMAVALERALLASEGPLAEAIADRTGTDLGRDLYPHLAATCTVGALRATIGFWLGTSGEPPRLAGMLRRAIFTAVPLAPSPTELKEAGDGD